LVDFPKQYWSSNSSAAPPDLACPVVTTTPSAPTQIYFAGTQYTTPAVQEWAANTCTGTPNGCSQIVAQSEQSTEVPGGLTSWQPPLPITIAGKGFGVLPYPLPFAGSASSLTNTAGTVQYLTISDNGNGNGGFGWSSSSAACQVYISDWNDTEIWLVANIPTGVQDDYLRDMGYSSIFLSPLSDVSQLTLQATLSGNAGCAVAVGDGLQFKVTNPQTGAAATTATITVGGPGTTLF
jgi:hypothetical protein